MKKSSLVRTLILAGSFLLQLSTLCFHSRGAAGNVDLSFDPGSGVNGPVFAVTLQPDGKLIIVGEFTIVRGLARSMIARLNADGSGDVSFDAGPQSYPPGYTLHTVALQPDGKVLVGDDYGIRRFSSDGSLDTSFDATGIDSLFYQGYAIVRSITVQPNGKVLIGGDLFTLNDANPHRGVNYGITRLNSDGSLDGSFSSAGIEPNSPGANDRFVHSLVMQADGKVLIGGEFTSVNGTNRNRIARLNANGNLESNFNPGTGTDSTVLFAGVQSDGKVLIGGSFTTVNGTARNKLARLNSDGGLDNSFNPGTGANGDVRSITLQSDGKVLIGGSFTTVDGTNRSRIARLNADASLDGSFDPGTGAETIVKSVVVQPDGKVLIGGVYTFINGTNRYGSARLNADGSLDSAFISEIFNPDLAVLYNPDCPSGYECFEYVVVNAVAVQSDGKVLLGGQLVRYECELTEGGCVIFYRYFVIRLHSNGSRDTSFEPAAGYLYVASSVGALAVQPDGKIIVGGSFSSIKGTNRNSIARLNANGSLDSSFNPGTGTGVSGTVSSVALQSNGKVLIGGNFSFVNGANRLGIARLNANGSLDSSFNPGTGAYGVSSIALQPDGKVLIGGEFTIVNGTNRNRIARLNANGSLDSSFNPGAGADGVVRSIALQSDGKVLIVGGFFTVNGVVRPHVARLYGDSVIVPALNIARSNAFVIVSWPVSSLSFQLQETTNIAPPNSWSSVAQAAATNGNQVSLTIPTSAGRKFFRLESP